MSWQARRRRVEQKLEQKLRRALRGGNTPLLQAQAYKDAMREYAVTMRAEMTRARMGREPNWPLVGLVAANLSTARARVIEVLFPLYDEGEREELWQELRRAEEEAGRWLAELREAAR